MNSSFTALRIAYVGKNYFGWARQPTKTITTIEERVLLALKKANIPLDGYKYASRTDKGVNAIEQTIKVKKNIEKTYLGKLNKFLPEDIRFWAKAEVSEDFSPRYPTKKTYQYCYYNSESLDIESIRKSCRLLEGKNNFKNFSQKDNKRFDTSTVRNLHKIEITTVNNFLIFTLEGDSFLWKMCRKIVWHLIQIGSGIKDINDTHELLNSAVKSHRLPKAISPYGLTLQKLSYPEINFRTEKKELSSFKNYLTGLYKANFSFSKAIQLLSKEII